MNNDMIYKMMEDIRERINVLMDRNNTVDGLAYEMLSITNSLLIISGVLLADLRILEMRVDMRSVYSRSTTAA